VIAVSGKSDDGGDRRNTRDRVYRLIYDGILQGAYPSGSFIEEERVCALAKVSRTPVREAFHRLEAERFIDLLPRRGAMVRHVTTRELTEVYEARRLIEGHAVAYLCQRRMPAPKRMAELCAEMDAAMSDLVRSVELNRLFHRELIAAIENRVLLDLFDSLHSRIIRVALSALRADPNRTALICAEHRGLVEALDRNDEVRAIDLLGAHLQPQSQVMAQLARL
jgi:DNA-binding GntR family transcriptional regulator